MSIVVDLIIVIILILSLFVGYKQGLIKAAIKIASFFIAIAVALILYQPVANVIINNTNIEKNIQNSITNKILPEGATPDSEVQISYIPDSIITSADNTVNSISHALAVKIIEVAALVAIYIIVRLALKFITVLADLIAKIPVLKQFNELRRINIWSLKRNHTYIFPACSGIIYCTNDK